MLSKVHSVDIYFTVVLPNLLMVLETSVSFTQHFLKDAKLNFSQPFYVTFPLGKKHEEILSMNHECSPLSILKRAMRSGFSENTHNTAVKQC